MIHVEQCTALTFLLLLVALLLHKVTSTTYYVIPDDYPMDHINANTFILQHYLNNTSKYFVSHNQFHFMQGQYYINSDLIINDIDNFTITGIGQCAIICTSPASIVVMNVNNIELQNINLTNCIKNQKDYFNISHFNTFYARDSMPFNEVTDHYTSLLLCNSSLIIINNMNISATVNTSFTAIVNVKNDSKLSNVKVQL